MFSADTITHERETDMSPLNLAALQQMITSVDEKHVEAHQRLRHDYRELRSQLDLGLQSIRNDLASSRMEIAKIEATPVDATKLVLTPKIVVGIVVTVVAIYGGIWASTYGLRSDVRDILSRIETQKTAVEAASKLQEVQANTLNKSIDEMRRRQELQQYEIQSLKEAVLTGKTNLVRK